MVGNVSNLVRLNIDVDSSLRARLKIAAARRGESVRKYCIEAISRRLAKEEPATLTASDAPLLAQLWDNDADAIYDDL